MPTSDHNFCIPLEEIYKRYSKKELITKLMDKIKLIDSAEKTITDQEIEIKELGQDIKRNRTVQALYKKIKDLQTQTELLLKNFSIEREQHQAEIMEKDMKIDKLVASWEKYNETRNKLKKKEEQVLLDTYCKVYLQVSL